MYKSIDDLPITFGPAELSAILGISRNKAYELANSTDFPKYRVGKKIIISKKHFIAWMDTQFGNSTDVS
jgi:predicted DNA-binding transcriptional regulator AlpA